MTGAGHSPAGPGGASRTGRETDDARFSSLLEDSAEDLYENAPCGYVSTLLDGKIAKINGTLLGWLARSRDELVGRCSFSDLLTVGGKLYYETHLAPLLSMQGEVGGLALELKTSDGRRLPVLVNCAVKTDNSGQPVLIRTTIFDARDRRAYERELLRARQEADRERERLRELAGTLQQSLLPPSLPVVPGLDAAAHYHPASADEVGGDFYDLFPLSEHRWGVSLGDVCGKGAHAATITSMIRYTLRTAAVYDADPAAVLSTLNPALHDRYLDDSQCFCTAIFGLLTPDGDGFTVALASGGHPDPLLMRADGTAHYVTLPAGPLIGMWDDAEFVTGTIRLGPGDTLLLFTDGLTEARTPDGDSTGRYGDQALGALATSLAPTTPDAAITAITALLDSLGTCVEDDTAVLALGVPAKSGTVGL
jgi:sigma-B regulation protein RsbU (phosphoserine phosphatase)